MRVEDTPHLELMRVEELDGGGGAAPGASCTSRAAASWQIVHLDWELLQLVDAGHELTEEAGEPSHHGGVASATRFQRVQLHTRMGTVLLLLDFDRRSFSQSKDNFAPKKKKHLPFSIAR